MSHYGPGPSNRIRLLTQWRVIYMDSNTPGIQIAKLGGFVVREADGSKPLIRYTWTSPIKSIEDNVVTTATGSLYTLLEPAKDQSPITNEKFNTWLDGNNWLTI